MMRSALQWWNCSKGKRLALHSIHCTPLQKSWRLGSWAAGESMPLCLCLDAYQEKHRCYPVPTGRVAALEEEGVAPADLTSREDSKSAVVAMDGINVCLVQAMSCYQREEQKCYVCGSPGHFAGDCSHHDAFKRWHQEQLNAKGVGENNLSTPKIMNQ